jgi:hypothetical protein
MKYKLQHNYITVRLRDDLENNTFIRGHLAEVIEKGVDVSLSIETGDLIIIRYFPSVMKTKDGEIGLSTADDIVAILDKEDKGELNEI